MSQAESLNHIAHATAGVSVPPKIYLPYSSGLFFSYTIQGCGPLLIVQAPGWGIGSSYLQTAFLPLESHFTLLHIEPRGSGNTVRPDEATMTTLQMAQDLELLRIYLGLEKMSLLGHSHGGVISLAYASRYPERVKTLITVGHSLPGYDDSAEWKRLAEKRKDDERYAFGYAKSITEPPQNDAEYTAQFCSKISFMFADPVTYHAAFLKTIPNLLSLWTFNALSAGDKGEVFELEDELVNVKARTLIVGANEDPMGSVEVSRITHARIAGSEMVVLEECGHFPWIEQPEKFFGTLVEFLTQSYNLCRHGSIIKV